MQIDHPNRRTGTAIGYRSALLLAIAVVASPFSGIASEPNRFPAGDDFGAGITLTSATPLADIVANPAKFEDQPVVVRGRITDVCQKKGCWTVITDDTVSVRVRFQDYGFFLPKDASGRDAIAEGFVRAETLSEKTARHYASESKNEDPDRIRGPQRVVGFTASGVRLLVRN